MDEVLKEYGMRLLVNEETGVLVYSGQWGIKMA